jgi:hypothetical protein
MKCPQVQKRLSAFQDGELKPRERKRITDHLQVCEVCRGGLAKLDGLWQALDGLTEIQPEADFYGQVIRKINACNECPSFVGLKGVYQLFSSLGGCTLLITGILIGTFLGNFMAGSDLLSSRPIVAGKTREAIEIVSFRAFDAVPPGTLGDGYIRMVSNTEMQNQ